MKIAVCIKQVPTREWQPRLNDAKTWIREGDASFEMNEPDAYALEESLRLKEKHGGEVVVCAAGPARAAQVIREALARGADRAIHVEDEGFGAADAFGVAGALADAMREGDGRILQEVAALGPSATWAVPTLSGLLTHSSPKVRTLAAKALGNMGSAASTAKAGLEAARNDPNAGVKTAADDALKRIGAAK